MPDRLPDHSVKLPYADSNESADSLEENQTPSFEQPHFTAEQRQEQAKVEQKEKLKAENELEQELDFFSEMLGDEISEDEVQELDNELQLRENNLSPEEEIKGLKKELLAQGKTPIAILQDFLSRFEDNHKMALWVENWKNFLRLHELASTKPPEEKKAIERIIFAADFGNTDAFSDALNQVESSDNISAETKLEISRTFGGSQVSSVKDIDRGLQKIKSQQKELSKTLADKTHEIESTKAEIQELRKELNTLPLGDPKIEKLETKLQIKKIQLDTFKKEAENLSNLISEDISFELRKGISSKLNLDGSRSIYLQKEQFTLKLPDHTLPFTGAKNLRAINLVFPFKILQSMNIASAIFPIPLRNNTMPNRTQREIGYIILSELGYNTRRILSQTDISQLQIDLSRLTNFQPMKSGKESLADLGIYHLDTKQLDIKAFQKTLKFIKEKRALADDLFSIQMKNRLKTK